MKIPFEDSRMEMKRRWTDIQKMHQTRFFDVYDFIDDCNKFSREELSQLQELINTKMDTFLESYGMAENN